MSGKLHHNPAREIFRLYKSARKLRRKFQVASTFDEKLKAIRSYIYLSSLASGKVKVTAETRIEQIENLKKTFAL